MKARQPNFLWLGIALALAYWLAESLMHTYIFDGAALGSTMLGEGDPNEVWMRLIISGLIIAFGWVAERTVLAERRLRENAVRLGRLLGFVDRVRQDVRSAEEEKAASPPDTQVILPNELRPSTLLVVPPMAGYAADNPGEGPGPFTGQPGDEDDIAKLARILRELSGHLDTRFNEIYALLQLIQEINKGFLLDDVFDRAYETLKSVLPYDRLSVALIEGGGRVVRVRWARCDDPQMMLPKAYAGWMSRGSLGSIIDSGQPRVISDLREYLRLHPESDSTRLMVAEGVRSSLTCPLISMGRAIGFMFFSSREVDTYRNAHVEIFKLIAGHLSIVVEKSNLYQQILHEKEKSQALLLNVMPARIAARLGAGETGIAERLPEICVLFADIVAFTEFASRHSPERVLDLLQNIFVPLDRLCGLYGVEKIKTIGDEYMVMSVSPGPRSDEHLHRLASFALEALSVVEAMRYPDGTPVRLRIGMHAGPGVAGLIGQQKYAYDIFGDAVNVASRMETAGESGRIHVSEEMHSRLKDAFVLQPRDEMLIKGVGKMKTYFLVGRKALPAVSI